MAACTTPHIDRFARGGAVFENAFSPHIPTTPAFTSLLTGRDCFGTGIVSLRDACDVGAPTLAQVLSAEGYATSCIGFSAPPVAQGFETCRDYMSWGDWEDRPLRKAERLAELALPELRRLADGDRPFFLMLRYMDAHSPYLPPPPFDRMFYAGDECDPAHKSMKPVLAFEPFRDYFTGWMPPGITDERLRHCPVRRRGGLHGRLHGRSADAGGRARAWRPTRSSCSPPTTASRFSEHACYFDHHGLYDNVLRVPLCSAMPGRVPAGLRVPDACLLQDVTPTVLDVLGVDAGLRFDGRSLLPALRGERRAPAREFYVTECTWMRKHGWRTPEWKLIHALEPDFHFGPEVELYNLIEDPEERTNLAARRAGRRRPAGEAHGGLDRPSRSRDGRPQPHAGGPARPRQPARPGAVPLLAGGVRLPAHQPARRPPPAPHALEKLRALGYA